MELDLTDLLNGAALGDSDLADDIRALAATEPKTACPAPRREFTPEPYEFLGHDADGLATYHVSWSL